MTFKFISSRRNLSIIFIVLAALAIGLALMRYSSYKASDDGEDIQGGYFEVVVSEEFNKQTKPGLGRIVIQGDCQLDNPPGQTLDTVNATLNFGVYLCKLTRANGSADEKFRIKSVTYVSVFTKQAYVIPLHEFRDDISDLYIGEAGGILSATIYGDGNVTTSFSQGQEKDL